MSLMDKSACCDPGYLFTSEDVNRDVPYWQLSLYVFIHQRH